MTAHCTCRACGYVEKSWVNRPFVERR